MVGEELFDKIGAAGEAVGQIGQGSFGSLTPVLDKIYLALQIIIPAVIVVALVLIFWKMFLQFKINVRIVKKSGGKIVDIINDRAKFVVDEQGKRKLVLWKTREGKEGKSIPIPEMYYKYKMGRKDYYDLSMDDNGNLHPNELIDSDEHLSSFIKPIPQERKAWDRYEDKLIIEKFKKKDWLEKYGNLAVISILSVTVILVMFFMFKFVGDSFYQLAQSILQLSTACGL